MSRRGSGDRASGSKLGAFARAVEGGVTLAFAELVRRKKLRRAVFRPGRERRTGVGVVGESKLSGGKQVLNGCQIAGKALVVEVDCRGIGDIRLRHISDNSSRGQQLVSTNFRQNVYWCKFTQQGC